jgi:predicted PolB exonuclease-like 3'-5' exonuclease
VKNLLIFDIETVPCVQTARNLLHLHDAAISDEVIIQKLTEYHLQITNGQNSFPRQLFHKIVCISFMFCEIDFVDGKETYITKELKTGGRNGESEAEILEKFCNFIGRVKPRIISFNGKTFDMPVIQYRSMMNKISAPWMHNRDFTYKYAQNLHIDLLDSFSNFGSSARIKMAEICALLNIPCKENASGDSVLSMYTDGKIKEICDYCESDVVATYILYLYFQMHAGVISAETLELCKQKALELM